MLELDLASSWTWEKGKTQVMMVARQKLLQDRLVLAQLACLKCVRGKSCLSATVAAAAWAGSLAQAAARLAGDDPSVRQRWKSPLNPSSVQLGRHFQRSVVQFHQ